MTQSNMTHFKYSLPVEIWVIWSMNPAFNKCNSCKSTKAKLKNDQKFQNCVYIDIDICRYRYTSVSMFPLTTLTKGENCHDVWQVLLVTNRSPSWEKDPAVYAKVPIGSNTEARGCVMSRGSLLKYQTSHKHFHLSHGGTGNGLDGERSLDSNPSQNTLRV